MLLLLLSVHIFKNLLKLYPQVDDNGMRAAMSYVWNWFPPEMRVNLALSITFNEIMFSHRSDDQALMGETELLLHRNYAAWWTHFQMRNAWARKLTMYPQRMSHADHTAADLQSFREDLFQGRFYHFLYI